MNSLSFSPHIDKHQYVKSMLEKAGYRVQHCFTLPGGQARQNVFLGFPKAILSLQQAARYNAPPGKRQKRGARS